MPVFHCVAFVMFHVRFAGRSSEMTFEERCIFSEHRCANHRLNYLTGPNRTTRYVRIVRAFFVVAKGVGLRMDYPAARLTFRTFTPLQLTRPTSGHMAEFEQTRQVIDRVNQWLQVTGETMCRDCAILLRMVKYEIWWLRVTCKVLGSRNPKRNSYPNRIYSPDQNVIRTLILTLTLSIIGRFVTWWETTAATLGIR